MSLAEVQQVYSMLQRINELLKDVEVRSDKVGAKVKTLRIKDDLREIEYLFFRVTTFMKQMGLPPEVSTAIFQLQRLAMAIRSVHTAWTFLTVSTPSPYTMAMGVITLVGLALSFAEEGSAKGGF